MADYSTEQDLRLAQKMLEQQGEINALRAERDALKAAESMWRDAQTGLFHEREAALCRAVAAENERDALTAELAEARRMHDALQAEVRGWSPTRLIAQIEELTAELAEARAAIEQVKELRDQWVLASMPAGAPLGWPSPAAVYADVVAWLDAVLDAPQRPEDARPGVPEETCSRCEGSRFEPGTEAEGDCSACNGTGKADQSNAPARSSVSAGTEATGACGLDVDHDGDHHYNIWNPLEASGGAGEAQEG